MPTAECRCNACGHEFVQMTFKGDEAPAVCPHCKGRDVQLKSEREGFMAGSLIAGVPKGPS